MSTVPHVHLSLDGELLAEIPFSSDRLQVGRLEENDIVVRDRAASRTHALLEREGERIYVEDVGSQNGIWLGGQRITGRVEIRPGDDLRIGRHTIRVGPAGSQLPTSHEPLPEPLQAETSAATGVEASTALAEAAACEEPADAADLDLFSIGEEELAEAAEPCASGEAWGVDEHEAEFEDPEADFQVGTGDPEEATASFPGLIVQRSGQLDRILAWDEDELCAGRGAECEIFLGAQEVSRRHALFVRSNDVYEVRDLDSINGVFVNGESVRQRVLCVGDVVQIETFELTFVLEREPIGSEIQAGQEILEPEIQQADHLSSTVQGLAPLVLATTEEPEIEEAEVNADEKELELAPQSFEQSAAGPIVFQLELDPESLPAPLRQALHELEQTEQLTVRVTLKRS